MALLKPNEKPYSDQVRKIWGYTGILGHNRTGKFVLGQDNPDAGIFRADRQSGRVKTVREVFHMQWKPRTANQLAAAQIFREGMIAWHDLTNEQKEEYNIAAGRIHIWGVNLFMREWMRSN